MGGGIITGGQLPPRVVISAPQGHSGKTTVSLGLCAALRCTGLAVQPFKKGPDYIDPSWLAAAAGLPCYNLDAVLMTQNTLLNSFQYHCGKADFALIEGAMGLYDGVDSAEEGSTAQLARMLGSPVILVINAVRMTQSVAAMVSGYQHFQPDINISGVILNNVSGSRHEQKLTAAIKQYCGIPVMGSIPKDKSIAIPERHLGLVPYGETERESIIERLCDRLEKHLDLDQIMDIARNAGQVNIPDITPLEIRPAAVKIGVIRDNVFTFYYPENLAALRQAGAELVFINSLNDTDLPEVDGLYIGGGFPELFLEGLEANRGLRRRIKEAIDDYLPVYAECAGLMYLCRSIRWHDESHEMAGVFPADVEICPRPQGHGYVQVETTGANPFFPPGLTLWGHEFHHSRLSMDAAFKPAYRIKRGNGIDGQVDGLVYKNVLAAYTHLHALGVPQWAEAFISLAFKTKYQRNLLPARN